MTLWIGLAVGYMLKVLRSRQKLTIFAAEFKAIRHGNYPQFIQLVKGEVPPNVVFKDGVVRQNALIEEDDHDFLGLFLAGPALEKFYKECSAVYGSLEDDNIPDFVYYNAALLEVSLRVTAFNDPEFKERMDLIDIISIVGTMKKLTEEQVSALQSGRKFVNFLKHNKPKFESIEEGMNILHKAIIICNDNDIVVMRGQFMNL